MLKARGLGKMGRTILHSTILTLMWMMMMVMMMILMTMMTMMTMMMMQMTMGRKSAQLCRAQP